MRRILFLLLVVAGIALLSGCEVPTEFSVTSTVDAPDAVPGDGVCETAVEDECTLRAAVMEANARDTPVVVELSPATYGTHGLEVTGTITIRGNDATIGNGTDGTSTFDNTGHLAIHEARLEGGGTLGTVDVTAVRNAGSLRLTDVEVTESLDGSPIENNAGTLIMGRSHIHANSPVGLAIGGGVAILVDSSIHHNGAYLYPGSASIIQSGGELLVVNSTIGPERFSRDIIRCFPSGCFPVGQWSNDGDGLRQTAGTATFLRSTVTGNDVGIDADGSVVLGGTVLASNTTDCTSPVTSQGFNLDEDGTCLDGSVSSDQPSTAALLPNVASSNAAEVFAVPAPGSPLLDAIPPGTSFLCDRQHPADQRGIPRPAGPGCDIGAVERQPTDP